MRWLEVRRHAPTKKGAARGRGSHLSAHGVALARAVGAESGPFALVVTSVSPRAIETAIAMGRAVDDTFDLPSGYVPGEVDHHDQWDWPQPYVRYAELIARGGELAAVAAVHRKTWTEVVRAVPDGSGALVVSHGGSIEPVLVSCLPDADHASWGAPFGHLDGVRLDFEDGRFNRVRLHRAPGASPDGSKAAESRSRVDLHGNRLKPAGPGRTHGS